MSHTGTATASIVRKAKSILNGTSKTLEDWRDALELLQAAAQLQSGEAYYIIGSMYESGDYMKRSQEKALSYYKQSLKLNYIQAAASMASTYATLDEQDNCEKLWDYYFKNVDEKEDGIDLNIFNYVLQMRSFGRTPRIYPIFATQGAKPIRHFEEKISFYTNYDHRISSLAEEYVSLKPHQTLRKRDIEAELLPRKEIEAIMAEGSYYGSIFQDFCNMMADYFEGQNSKQ